MKYHEMTKNYIFRELECGLSIEQTAELCFKSVRTIKEWDKGQTIPKECKRLMRNHIRLELSHDVQWQGFRMIGNKMEIPNGKLVSPQELITGIALLDVQSELELQTTSKLLKYARIIGTLRYKNRN
jgi:hypothetical protein